MNSALRGEIRLYSWSDILEVFQETKERNEWPQALIEVESYLDGVTLKVAEESREHVLSWLRAAFSPRFIDSDLYSPPRIHLESSSRAKRSLDVRFESPTSENARDERPRSFDPSFRVDRCDKPWTPSVANDSTPILACHSFKGGVGRTTIALATALQLQKIGKRVLLIDADMEAPGLSWIWKSRQPTPSISYADVLSLLHERGAEDLDGVAEICSARIGDSVASGIYFLPAFRTARQFHSPPIRPEHLRRATGMPSLAKALSKIGERLTVDLVIIDLRAGFSELASDLILDSSVFRLFVSTVSGQSVQGTLEVLKYLERTIPKGATSSPVPAVAITQAREEDITSGEVDDVQRLLRSAVLGLGPDIDPVAPTISTIPHLPELASVPNDFDKATARISASRLTERLKEIVDWLPLVKSAAVEPNILRSQRASLERTTEKLEYAESSEESAFLSTVPIRKLAEDHLTAPPISLVVGNKGAGKTYLFVQVARAGNWQDFVRRTSSELATRTSGGPILVFPAVESFNLHDSVKQEMTSARREVARRISASEQPLQSWVRDEIQRGLRSQFDIGQWREHWISVLLGSLGKLPGNSTPIPDLKASLDKAGSRILFIVDGIEDNFQSIASNTHMQIAVRALLQDVPDWLSQSSERSIGLLVFVRRDIVASAVQQNSGQLLGRYKQFELHWDRQEALRLAAWVARRIEHYPWEDETDPSNLTEEQLVDVLRPLWGKKLGKDDSREGRSIEYVIAALSDYNGHVQARDVVRFLNVAAKKSMDDTRWIDRVLAPQAIRDAIPDCSTRKIEELEQENKELGSLLDRLRSVSVSSRQIPFSDSEIALQQTEVEGLEKHGVIRRVDNEYYISEIFRHGLGYSLKGGARPKVIGMAGGIRKSR